MTSENQEDEIAHLAEEHGLIKTTAFIRSNSSNQRSANAARAAKHRQQKKERSLVPIDVPVSVAQEIKAAGSFEEWIRKKYGRSVGCLFAILKNVRAHWSLQ